MRGSIIIAILCLFPLVSSTEYHFKFNLKLTCHLKERKQFGVNIQFFDEDTGLFNGRDEITKPFLKVFDVNVTNEFEMNGIQKGDEILSNGFDVRLFMWHNCCNGCIYTRESYDRELFVHKVLKPLFPIPSGDDDVYYEYNIDLDISEMSGFTAYFGNLTQSRT